MGVLLMLVGLLGLAAGGSKLRSRVRQSTGYSPVAVLEALLGAVTLAGSGVGLSQVRPLAWTLVVATISTTFLSTWIHARLVSNYVKNRERSEELRLRAYLHSREER